MAKLAGQLISKNTCNSRYCTTQNSISLQIYRIKLLPEQNINISNYDDMVDEILFLEV